MDQKTLPQIQRALWAKLAGVKEVFQYYLARGTAVALHLGHRESIDFDFFSERKDIPRSLIDQLKKLGDLEIQQDEASTFLGILDGVRISFFHYSYSLLSPAIQYKGVRICQLEDLVAMKIIAIGQRGTKKDFIDMHAILQSGWNFEAIFDAVEKKYRDARYNKMHLLKSLTYFDDAQEDPMPKMIQELSWDQVKHNLEEEVRYFLKVNAP